MTSSLFNFLRFVLWPRIWALLVNVHVHLKRMYVLECSINPDQVSVIDSVVQVFPTLTDFLFVLSLTEGEVMKSPTVTVGLFLFQLCHFLLHMF